MNQAHPSPLSFVSASPTRVAVLLNVLVALVVSLAVVLHLRTQRTQALHDVQTQVANMARSQALLIANQIRNYDSLLQQLEIQLNIATTLATRTGHDKDVDEHVHDLLRNFHDLAADKKDLLLVAEDGSYHAASDLLDSLSHLRQYCRGMELSRLEPGTWQVLVYNGPAVGRCPAPGTLMYQKALRTPAGQPQQYLWLLFNPEGFQSALQKDRVTWGADAQYRVLSASRQELLRSSHEPDAERWRFPLNTQPLPLLPDVRAGAWEHAEHGYSMGGVQALVPGTELQVQMVYRTEEAITPQWRPVVQLWGSLAAGFLFLWWVVSFLVVQMVRKHQEDIQTREERFERSLEYADLGVWDWDIPSGKLHWSQHAAPMLGLPDTLQEAHDDTFMAAVHPDDRASVHEAIRRSLEHGELYSASYRVVWPDKSVHWLREWGNVQRDAHGQPVRMLGVMQDITEQRAARSHQRLLETVVSQLNDMVFITDAPADPQADVRVVFVNQAFTEHTGYTSEAARGMPLGQLFGPQTDAQSAAQLRQAIAYKEPLRTDMQLCNRHGQHQWMELNIQPLIESQGQVSNWVVVARDTSQRKAAEAALKGSENRLSGVLESAMDAIISIDESHRIILFNAAAQRTFGRSAEEMLGQPLDTLLPHGIRALHTRHLQGYHTAQESSNNRIMAPRSHLKALRANGQEFPIEASISRVRVDGGMVFTVILRDMTERVEADRKLHELNETLEQRVTRRTQELQVALDSAEQAKRSRGEFLAKMSHEMRTPLNAVLGLTYLALRANPGSAMATFLEKIQHSGKHLLRTINDILDFSKIDAGKLQIESEAFDLQLAIRDALQMTEERALEKQLALQVEVASEVPRYAEGDALRLTQVLINYVNNAIKFTQAGHVTVRVMLEGHHPATATQEPPSSGPFMLRVEVQDTGIGLSARQKERLFESFEQADNSTTRRFGGTGLGLAICKQLATLMGGAVGVNSQEGVGSVFWFTAQLQYCAQPLPGERDTDRKSALQTVQGRRMLVVDDNELNVEIAVGILQGWGIQTLAAHNGLMALDVLRTQAVDLVLMDMHMPQMDGLQATRQLRADPALQALPVIAMTANARREDHALCMEAGMNAVVTKPFVPDHLLKVLGHCLGSTGSNPAADPAAPEPAAEPTPQTGPATQDSAAIPELWDDTRLSVFVGNNVSQHVRLLSKFLDTLVQFDATLQTPDAQDTKALAQVAHKIKSSARTVGALRLASLCEALEEAGHAGDSLECSRLVSALDTCLPATQACVTTHMQSLQATTP